MKSLIYLYCADLYSPKVNVIQSLNTISALGKYYEVKYLSHVISKSYFHNLLSMYGLAFTFRLVRLPFFRVRDSLINLYRLAYSLFSILYLKRSKADYIYTRDISFLYLASFFPKWFFPNSKIVFEAHKIYFQTSEVVNYKKEKRSYSIVDYFVATTHQTKKELTEKFSVNKEDICVCSNGINLLHFQKNRSYDVLNELGIKQESNIVIYAGSFLWWKRVDTLVKSFVHTNKDVKLLLVGGYGKDFHRIKKLVKKLNLQAKIYFTGYLSQDQLITLLKLAEIGIIPNNKSTEGTNYTSPVKMFEYMACGLPVIISDLPAMKEVVKEKRNCLFFKPENEIDLAKKINLLLNNKKLRDRMRKNNLQDIKKYAWDAKAKKIEEFLRLK